MADADYRRALIQEGRDLVDEARQGLLPRVRFRDQAIARVLELLDAGSSVLVVGKEHSGRTALIYGVARALASREHGGLFQLSTASFFVDTRYIGEWQTKSTRIAEVAAKKKAAVYLTDVWNLPVVGRTSKNDGSLLDALRPFLESSRLRLLGEVTPPQLAEMEKSPGFVGFFKQVSLEPLGPEQVRELLVGRARALDLDLDEPSIEALLSLPARFMPARPQPGPSLDLLAQVSDYALQKRAVGEPEPLSRGFIEKVFSIYSGLPRFVVSREVSLPVRELRAWFQERIVGQEEAIEAVVEVITLFKAGLHDPTRPIGTFLFVGPTGVGKTEMARALATFLFGSSSRMLRFDLSEFKDYHAFDMLLGNPQKPGQPARLLDPVRAQPFQVVLFDELEKAHPNIWDVFLQLLDEGRLSPPGGEAVSFRNTIVIATSNVGSQEAAASLGFGQGASSSRRDRDVRRALERAFRPEFLNRFQHLVVFRPLEQHQLRVIARQELGRVLEREGVTGRDLVVEVDDAVLDHVIAQGFDARYGARALKREIQRRLVLPLAVTLVEHPPERGCILRAQVQGERVRVRIIDTAASREAAREAEPVQPVPGRKLTRAGALEELHTAMGELAALEAAMDLPGLQRRREELGQQAAQHDLWNKPRLAAVVLRDLDQVTRSVKRVQRLNERAADLELALREAQRRGALRELAQRLVALEDDLRSARRELLLMGPEGHWDALLELRPLGHRGRAARDLLARTYLKWAAWRKLNVRYLAEPLADDEPILLLLEGEHAAGWLRHEAGLHRLRKDQDTSVVRVRVAPWTDQRSELCIVAQRALKASGQLGGRVRSRLECAGGLLLQNSQTLAANRDLAPELVAAWAAVPPASDEVVRSIYQRPFRLVDAATGTRTGRGEVLKPPGFHALLAARIDRLGAPRGSEELPPDAR